MNTKPINFRTKTQHKSKSASLSQQFVKIERVLTQYEKKKFHPKNDNFNYMSSQTITKQQQKRKFHLNNNNKDSLSSEKIFGPLPEVFTKPKTNRITQKSYDITQITLASSQQKQTYVKMSKLRNHQKRRKLIQAYPKHTEKYIASINQNLIELLGRQMQLPNSFSSREDLSYQHKRSIDLHYDRSYLQTKTQTPLKPMCKKYAQIQIEQLLQNNTKLTMSQKRRITEYNKRNQTPQHIDEGFKRRKRVYRKDKTMIVVNSEGNDSVKSIKQQNIVIINNTDKQDIKDDQRLDYSNKGWLIVQQCDSNIITI